MWFWWEYVRCRTDAIVDYALAWLHKTFHIVFSRSFLGALFCIDSKAVVGVY